jgi:hypothetical protein
MPLSIAPGRIVSTTCSIGNVHTEVATLATNSGILVSRCTDVPHRPRYRIYGANKTVDGEEREEV